MRVNVSLKRSEAKGDGGGKGGSEDKEGVMNTNIRVKVA